MILLGAREGVNGKNGVNPTRSRHCNDAAAFKSDACLCVEAVSTSDGDSKLAKPLTVGVCLYLDDFCRKRQKSFLIISKKY